MTCVSRRWTLRLAEEYGHADLTDRLRDAVAASGVTVGMALVHVTGSTGAVTTIEYEPGALADLRRALDRIAPADEGYAHNARWGDGNGFAHVRSAILKTGIAIPVIDRELSLGTWEQVVVLNLDNRARKREVVAVVMGE